MKKILYVMLIASSASLCTPAHSEITLEQAQCRDAYLARHNFVPAKCSQKYKTCSGPAYREQSEMCIAFGRDMHWTYAELKECAADTNLAEAAPCVKEYISCAKEASKVLHEMGRECGIHFLNLEDQ